MTLVQMRDAIVNQMNSTWAHAECPVYYENTLEVDLATVGDYFIKCEISFDKATQANVGPTPFQRTHGTLIFTIYGRQTLGTRTLLGYLDELSARFRYATLSAVHLQSASVGHEVSMYGWFSMEMRVPFFADSNA